MKGEKIMYFGYSDRDDTNGDGYVDFNERAEADYAYDSIMGTNIFGFCPENERDDSDCFDDDEDYNEDEDYDDEDDEDYDDDEYDCDSDDCDEW